MPIAYALLVLGHIFIAVGYSMHLVHVLTH
jgi:hypothetical protein